MNEIRHISTSYNTSKIALAEFTNKVQIFDIASRSVISEFDTILDFGGRRLSITPNGNICICGCWERHGIVAYNAESGAAIWQRKDLKKPQRLYCSYQNNEMIFVRFEKGSSRMLDIQTGVDFKKITGIESFWDSQYEPVEVYQKSSGITLNDSLTKKAISRIPKHSFATLSLTFASNSFAMSESGGPLSCYSTADGKLLWQIPNVTGEHFLSVSYNASTNCYLGVTWPYAKGGNKKLKVIHPGTGTVESELDLNSPAEAEFALNGKALVTSDRILVDTASLKITDWNESV